MEDERLYGPDPDGFPHVSFSIVAYASLNSVLVKKRRNEPLSYTVEGLDVNDRHRRNDDARPLDCPQRGIETGARPIRKPLFTAVKLRFLTRF